MKKILTLSIFFVSILLSTKTTIAQSWQLVWSDEFTTTIGPDWVFETGAGGWGNNELQYYRKENASIQNGALVITAKKEAFGGANYTSVRMKTQGKKSWAYGKIEARIAMPSFSGAWPAFWMLGDNIGTVGWPKCGEIDIMEHVNTGGQINGTVHWADANGNYASYGGITNTTVTSYHVYSIEWTPTYIRWFLDGTKYHEIDITNNVGSTEEFQRNFFILLNFAVGGNWPGFTIDNNAFPAKMLVDYVRVYKQTTTTPPPAPFTKLIQAESYNAMLGVQTEATTDAGGGLNVAYIDNGDWMAYNNINFPTSGSYTIEYRVASLNGGGKISLDLNAGSIVLGAVNVPGTGGWQNWSTISQTVNVTAGTYNLGVYATTGGFNLNWIRITKNNTALLKTATNTQRNTNLILYPNPVNQQLNLDSKLNLTGANIVIKDITGKSFIQEVVNKKSINVASLKPGMYIITIVTKEGDVVTQKFNKY